MDNDTIPPSQLQPSSDYGVGPVPVLPPSQPEEDSFDSPPDREGLKSIISTVLILLAAPLIALCLTAFVFQSYEVDGPSMQTTLENKDRLIVLKTPRTWAKITRSNYIPARGDIIIFSKAGTIDIGHTREKQLIKRVIGLPGERVVVDNGEVTVYNKEHPEGLQPDKAMSYGSVIGFTSGQVDMVVPEGQVFVCGDNRSNSLDSRAFGAVESKDIIGKLAVRILPLSKAQRF